MQASSARFMPMPYSSLKAHSSDPALRLPFQLVSFGSSKICTTTVNLKIIGTLYAYRSESIRFISSLRVDFLIAILDQTFSVKGNCKKYLGIREVNPAAKSARFLNLVIDMKFRVLFKVDIDKASDLGWTPSQYNA